MQKGYLSQYFDGIAAKKISAVEADPLVSNQHEFNGVLKLKAIFGTPDDKLQLWTRFLFLDDYSEPIASDGSLTWYDARMNHPVRTEWRLYYSSNDVSRYMSAGDSLYICKKKDGTALAIIARSGTSIENQLNWLFDIHDMADHSFEVKSESDLRRSELIYASRLILDIIGIQVIDYADEYLGDMIGRFGSSFPRTRVFSDYARSTLSSYSYIDDPDSALLDLLDREEMLFRSFEKHILCGRLGMGFLRGDTVDVDEFISFSLSVLNRRKSRIGHALENHLEDILIENRIRYSRTPTTENRSRPDFIFPGIEQYNNPDYPVVNLTMLGVKSTCKDRWRQVLDEADRIKRKHLLTLEAAISENQTDTMQERNLQLVVPYRLHPSYTVKQQNWLCRVKDFLHEVKKKQMV